MPDVFKAGLGDAAVGDMKATQFRVFHGRGAAFEGTKGLPMAGFTDSTANTILIVQAARPVPWTKPDVLPFLPDKRLPKLGEVFRGDLTKGFYAAYADGFVQQVKGVDDKTVRALITRNGNEPVTRPGLKD
jgi:hypothetical protein